MGMKIVAPRGDLALQVGDAVYDRHGNELLSAGGRSRGTCLGKMRMAASRPPDARECKRRVCDSGVWRNWFRSQRRGSRAAARPAGTGPS